MSKIGRKAIPLGDVTVQVNGQTITYQGKKASGSYELPAFITGHVNEKSLKLDVSQGKEDSETKRLWGLHRALLANAIYGAGNGFTKQLQINGLGFKASIAGNKIIFSIGYTHKIELLLPKDVTLEIDKTGQLLTIKSSNKSHLGEICDKIRSFRVPEPYKGTGIKYLTEVINRKAGKTKAA